MPKHGKFWKNKDLHAWMEGIEGGIALPPQFYGAEADGATDDTSAINQWIGQEGLKFLPYGDYLASGSVTGFSRPTLILADNAEESGTPLPFLAITDPAVGFKSTPHVLAFVYQNTTNRSDLRTVDIRRVVNTNDGHTNPHALHVETTKNDSNAQTEWAIAGVLNNYSNTAANGDAAVNGVSNKYGTASTFAGHFQTNEQFKTASASSVTPTIGAEMNIQAIGLDHPTANAGYGNRRVLDILPRTNTGIATWNVAVDNYGEAEIGAGVAIRTDDQTDAYFRVALAIFESAGNASPIPTALQVQTSGAYGLNIIGNNSTAAIRLTGTTPYGIVCLGTYSGAALRVPNGQYIAVDSTAAIKTGYGITANIWGFYNGGTERLGINMASGIIRVNGTQVLGPRITGWGADTGTDKRTANATYSGTASAAYVQAELQAVMDAVRDATQTIKALKADLFTLGPIGV